MQQLLTGKKRLPGFEGEWDDLSFESIATLRKDKLEPQRTNKSFKCVELEHIESETGNLIGFADSSSQSSIKSKFNPGDVLFGKLRPYLHKFWLCKWEGVCSTEAWVLKTNRRVCSPTFLFYLIQSDAFKHIANVSCGSKMPRAEWGYVKSCKLKVPSIPEQKAMVHYFKLLDDIARILTLRKSELASQKQALMQQLLTGKRRVKVDD